jgi:phage-related protein
MGKVAVDYTSAVKALKKISKSATDTSKDLGKIDESAQKSEKATSNFGKSTEDAGNKAQNTGRKYDSWRRVLTNTGTVIGKVVEKCGEFGSKVSDSGTQTEKSGSKILSVFKKIGSSIVSSFKSEPIKKVETSLVELTDTISKQENDLDLLKKKYQDLYLSQGKTSSEAKACADEIEKLSSELQDNKERLSEAENAADRFDKSIRDTGDSAEKANDGFTVWKATLANLASTVITKAISGCTQLAGKIADVTKAAVGNYAEYEQLVGGVETLFKDSSDTLIGYAKKAYKTAGMSSNQYMDTATSFAASLIQGLGGDTAKAVELTNLAITDMSDNANKMGTDIGSIQDAYQGFAKQNYTMLDNLKLGYGGTQSEMIRLINDSGVLGERIESLDNVTFDQMIEAIHKIQDNLGITGTTALEAGTTILGSWSSVQALFENILTKVGSKLAPTVMGFLQQLSDWMETVDWDEFAASVGDALQSVFDWIQKIDFTTFFERGMDGVTKFIQGLSGFADKVIDVVNNVQNFIKILTALSPIILGIVTTLGTLAAAFKIAEIINKVKTAVMGLFAVMAANPMVAAIAIIAGFVVALITLWNTNETVRNAVINAWNAIKNAVSTVVESIKGFFTGLVDSIKQAWENIKTAISEKIDIIKETVTNVFTAIADTVSAVWETIKNAVQVAIMFIGEIISAAFQIITMPWMFIWENCKEYIIAAWEFIKNAVSTALDAISTTVSNIWNAIVGFLTPILEGIKNTFTTVWNAIKSTISTALNAIQTTISSILNSIKSTFTSVWNSIKSTVSNVINGVKSTISSGLNAAKSTVSGVLNSIKAAFSNVWNGCKSVVSNAINHIKSIMHFSWSLPKLKLPHISISGSFSLTPPSVPHFGIEWYKKAMDDGMVMNQPTVFGYNAKTGQLMAGGEAGSETVVGTQNLMNMIKTAVSESSESNDHTDEVLEAIYYWLSNGGLEKLLIDILTQKVKLRWENREIARLVKEYA